MKRLLALLLCLVIGLCGCTQGGTEESSLVQDDSKMEESSMAEESSKKEESTAVEESSKAEESSVVEESSVAEESSTPEESAPEVAPYLTESAPGTWFNAYLEIIEYLTDLYGEGREGEFHFEGLFLVQLIDFDQNGQKELLCGYIADTHWTKELVYGYDGEKAVLLWEHNAGSGNMGTPLTIVLEKDGFYYVKQKDGAQDYLFGFKDGIFTETDVIVWPHHWNNENIGHDAVLEKYNTYTEVYNVDGHLEDAGDSPHVLDDTKETIEWLQKEPVLEEFGSVFEPNPIESYEVTQVYPAGTFSSMEEAYAQIVQELEAEYGVGEIKAGEYSSYYVGLCVVRLIDFDGDGQDELFCGYSVKSLAPEVHAYQKIYSYDGNGGVKLLWDTKAGAKGGVTFYSNIVERVDGKAYVVMMDQDMRDCWTLIDGRFQNVYQYCPGYTNEGPHWNGEMMSREDMLAKEEVFLDGSQQLIYICYSDVDPEEEDDNLPQTQATVEQLYRAAGMQDSILSAYRQVISDLILEYGEKHDGTYYVFGCVMAKLIDFDNNGVPELFCSYSPKGAREDDVTSYNDIIYGYKDGDAVMLYSGTGSNYGSGIKPGLRFLLKDDQYYYVLEKQGTTQYWSLSDGEFSVVFSAYQSFPPDTFRINNESVSEDEYKSQLNQFLENGTIESYSYYTEGSGMRPDGYIPVAVEAI